MTFILPKNPQTSDIKPFVVACEGMGDVTFVDRLLRDLGITNCCVGCPSDESSGGQGVERIGSFLRGIQTLIQGRRILSGVAVVADADRSRQDKLKTIRKGFESARFPKPRGVYRLREENSLRVGVYFIPGKGKSGTLEHLLLEAAFRKKPHLEKCIDHFSTCSRTGVRGWPPNKRAKMKMSALVSVTCKRNPWASPNTMWGDKGLPVPITSPVFDEIRKFLSDFTH